MSSCVSEESETKMQNDQHTIRCEKVLFLPQMEIVTGKKKLFSSVRAIYNFVQGLYFLTRQRSH